MDGALPFRFRLRADDGAVVAVSGGLGSFSTVKAAIMAVREGAATGLVVDLTGSTSAGPSRHDAGPVSPGSPEWDIPQR